MLMISYSEPLPNSINSKSWLVLCKADCLEILRYASKIVALQLKAEVDGDWFGIPPAEHEVRAGDQ
jgi:hypothetical protein